MADRVVHPWREKEMHRSRRAKALVAPSGELVMTPLAGITASSTTDLSSVEPAALGLWMRDDGLTTTTEPLERGNPVPHVTVHGRR